MRRTILIGVAAALVASGGALASSGPAPVWFATLDRAEAAMGATVRQVIDDDHDVLWAGEARPRISRVDVVCFPFRMAFACQGSAAVVRQVPRQALLLAAWAVFDGRWRPGATRVLRLRVPPGGWIRLRADLLPPALRDQGAPAP